MSDVRRLVREMDAHLARATMADASDRKIRAALDSRAGRGGPRVAPWTLAAATVVVAVLAFGLGRMAAGPSPVPAPPGPPAAPAAAPAVATVQTPSPEAPCVEQAGASLSLRGVCHHEADGWDVTTWDTASLRITADGARMHTGWALFHVTPVGEGAPVRVHVSEGTIEVLGTRFVVFQDASGGHVDLLEGSIRFVDPSGVITNVTPGERHGWGALDTADAAPARSGAGTAAGTGDMREGAPTRARVPGVEIPFEEIAGLRAAGRYADAVRRIRAIDRSRLSSRDAETLSYEEGTILQDHLDDAAAACQHWRAHQRRFPGGRYRSSVRKRLDRAACPEP